MPIRAEEDIAAVTEPDYEWGIKYCSFRSGRPRIKWGYAEDPRINGTIDEDREVLIDNYYYYKVIAVGKRIKNPEAWEDV